MFVCVYLVCMRMCRYASMHLWMWMCFKVMDCFICYRIVFNYFSSFQLPPASLEFIRTSSPYSSGHEVLNFEAVLFNGTVVPFGINITGRYLAKLKIKIIYFCDRRQFMTIKDNRFYQKNQDLCRFSKVRKPKSQYWVAYLFPNI